MIGGLRSPSPPHPLHTFRIYPPPPTPAFEYTFCTPISNPTEHGVEDAVHEIHTDNNLPHFTFPHPTHPLHGVDTRHKTQTHTHYTELTNTHTTHTHTTGQDRPEENCRSSCDGEGYNKVQQMQDGENNSLRIQRRVEMSSGAYYRIPERNNRRETLSSKVCVPGGVECTGSGNHYSTDEAIHKGGEIFTSAISNPHTLNC